MCNSELANDTKIIPVCQLNNWSLRFNLHPAVKNDSFAGVFKLSLWAIPIQWLALRLKPREKKEKGKSC